MNFLLTIAVNTCNNHFKKKSPDIVDMDTLSAVPSDLNISEEVLRQEDAKIIQQAIDRLPDMQKEVVILRFYHWDDRFDYHFGNYSIHKPTNGIAYVGNGLVSICTL